MLTHISQRTHKSYPFSHLIRHCFLLLLAYWLLVSPLAAQNDKDTPALELGKPIERELAGDAAHSYRITLAVNQFLNVIVEQKGIDVIVTLFAPDGKKVAEVDSPNGTQGPEPVSMIAETAGSYRLEVRSLEKTAAVGRYEVKIEELRTATAQDKRRIAVEQAFMQAELLRGQGTIESQQSAIRKYEETLPLYRTLGDHRGKATALGNIGLVYFGLGEKQKALDYFAQALPLLRAVGDRSAEATMLNDLGVVYSDLGEMRKALEYYNQALPLRRAAGYREGEAVTLTNIGHLYLELGERQKALDNFSEALVLARAISSGRTEAVLLNNIGLTYDALGEKQKALDFMNQALGILRTMGDRRSEAGLLNNIGSMYSDLGEHRKAIAYLNEALPLVRAAGDPNTETAMLANIGLGYNLLGEYQKAAIYLEQALRLSKAIGSRKEEGIDLLGLGNTYLKTGRVTEGLDLLDRALALFRYIKYPSGEARVHIDVARFRRERGELDAARSQIESALGIFESSRTKITSRDLRASYFASVQDHYEFYIDVLMQLHNLRPAGGHDAAALQVSERARARALLELLTEANADIRQGVDPALLERERFLRRRLNETAQRQMTSLSSQGVGEQEGSIAREIEGLTTELQQVEAQIRQTSPRYAALTQPTPLALREIQTQVLDDDTLLLEYSLGTDRSYLWAVTSTSVTSYELPKREEIEKAARRFYELITVTPRQAALATPEKRETGETSQLQDGTQLTKEAAHLSRILLAPVAPLLGKKRLLMVGDGALQYIPFAALPTPTGGVGRAATTPLIVEHEIVNLPSASTLAVLRREVSGRQPAPKTLAVLADPVFERSDERFKAQVGKTEASDPRSNARADEWLGRSVVVAASARQSGVADAGLRIRRLPGTRREADEIVKLVPPDNYKKALDFAANRVTATSPVLGQYRYVHFATHGFLNSQHPELSGIVLSMFDEQGAPQDGFLRAHEVFNLKLTADVVVLSACRTGLGKEIRGEGLVGLTRGFMYAGAPRVVVSLWNVNDAATAELMTRFYRGMLVDKLRPAKALQAAQVSMLNEQRYSMPFYWAAFTLQGEWR